MSTKLNKLPKNKNLRFIEGIKIHNFLDEDDFHDDQ